MEKAMVKEVKQGVKTLHVCEVCGLAYEEAEWAGKCQSWCETHEGSCNLEYLQHSILLEGKAEG